MKRTRDTEDLLAPGEATRQVGLMQQLYRGTTRPECPDCEGHGGTPTRGDRKDPRKTGATVLCPACGGTGRAPE